MLLHQAARNGDIKEARAQIREIENDISSEKSRKLVLEQKDQFGLTALHYAVKYSHLEIVQLLVANKTNINVVGKDGATPIHYVTCFTRGSDASILQYLIRNGACVNAVDDHLYTPLHYSCNKGNLRVVQELTDNPDIDIEPADHLRNTPLHNACSVGSIDIAQILIEKGANVLCENDGKFTPLHTACSQGHEKVLNYLLDVIQTKYGFGKLASILEQKNSEGQTLLHLAVLASQVSITKNLLERGCDVKSTMDGCETALHLAAVIGSKEIVELLIKFQVDRDVDLQNEDGRTPLHKAARFGKDKVVSLLLEKGADVNLVDDEGISPLILASMISSNPTTIKILLENGADVLITDVEDRTALHIATNENNISGVKALLDSDDSTGLIDLRDKDSNSCLHIACANGYEDIAVHLLKKITNVKSRNNENKTPLHLAASFGQDNVVDNIIDIDASSINDIDNHGNAPLHLAARNGHSDVIKYLLKCGSAVDDKNANGLTPVDCAACNGHTEAIKVLIWGGASLEQRDETNLSPLHYSCKHGHVEATKCLLEHCDVGLTSDGRNSLDLAIDNLHEDVVKVIINHRDWKRGLRNKTLEDGEVMTPVRKMIKRLPDVAYHTFSRCISAEDERPIDHEDYEVTLTYEFIDDVYNDWPSDFVHMDNKEGRGKGEKLTEAKLQKMMERKDTHTFCHMERYGRKDLLLHPLVIASIEKKWQHFAAYLYYFKMVLYTCFLTFLSGYILVTAPLREPYRSKDCTITHEAATWDMMIFVFIGKYIVLVLALIHLLFEVFQIFGQQLEYFAVDNLLEWFIYLLAIANVIDDFITLPFLQDGLVCGVYQKSVGASCLFLAWLNFILFIRKVPVFGIYIVMFLYIIKTFFRFFVVFVFLIAAFAFSFCVLLQDQTVLPAFHNPLGAMIKTGVMMTGEMGFDDIFYSDDHEADIVLWIIFVIFVLIMNIVLMNLLVGLAVDDIQAVQKEAEMTKATMQIDICLDSEKTLPGNLRRKFAVHNQVIYLNRDDELPKNISEETFKQIKEIIHEEAKPIDQLQDNLKNLKTDLTRLDNRIEDIGDQMNEVTEINKKLDNLEIMIKDIVKNQKRKRKHREHAVDKSPTGKLSSGKPSPGKKPKEGEIEHRSDETHTGDEAG